MPLLQQDAQAELNAAQKTGNQETIGTAQNAVQGVQNLGVETNNLAKQVRDSLTKDFDNFFMGLGRSTKSAADQFKELAASVVASLEQMIAKALVAKMMGALAGPAGTGQGSQAGGGGGGLFGGGGSGGGGGVGGILGGIAQIAMLFLADGGLVKGPGSGTSDSIPARLSHGEYVMKADAVSSFGVKNLDAINRGLKIPSLANMPMPRFAEGGPVGMATQRADDSSINLGIGLDEGLILKHLSSKAAGNIILHHLAANPKAAQHAISRSS